jgi:hypothetical protein
MTVRPVRSVTVYRGTEVLEVQNVDVTWVELRQWRDRELERTDWMALKDNVLPNTWKDYRTALRDLPQDNATANDAADNWPEAPE